MADTSASDVAKFMVEELDKRKYLDQEIIVQKIKKQFGGAFVYINENGNYAIARGVLKEFKKLTPDVVWDRGERAWRRRLKFDTQGKRQQG